MSEQHTDPNAAYNAEVRRIAEILSAANHCPTTYRKVKEGSAGADLQVYPDSIEHNLYKARAMVAEMAKLVKQALYHNAPDRNPLFINKYLIERGLIPADAEEGGQDGDITNNI